MILNEVLIAHKLIEKIRYDLLAIADFLMHRSDYIYNKEMM